MERTPVIGVTRCSRLDDYIASVEQSGGRTRILDVSDSPRQVVEQIDGLLLTGGGDIDPVLYREERHSSVQDAEPGRDEFEIDLARRAIDCNLPVLAICRGAQVLNVADGGTLVQDVPSAVASTLSHSMAKPRDHIAHDIAVTPGSRLQHALGDAVSSRHTCRVNSRHHQAVGQLGRSLLASATAGDGVVEAIEAPDRDFCIGVQWHPENFWRTGEFRGLFDSFVASAMRRAHP
ncbi:MAG: gamma-glutamyl-gamma-aminobutyrate hydrolase family protein [Acidobacteria bacterium]|nr:gamma-glutamyl-gamma-aminobutyrate hydrolase family protein [Acidobacteriota bacterium]